jgi:O-antigen/teichoic acid export membrane protein
MWRRVVHDTAIVISGGVAVAVLQVAFRAVAIGSVSIDTYGRAAFLLSIFNALAVVGQFGVVGAAARLSARTHGRRRDVETLRALTLAAAGPTLAAAVAMALATWAVTGSVLFAIIGALGLPPFVIACCCMGFIRGKGWIWAASSVQPANMVAQLAIFAGLVAAGVHVGVGWILGSYYLGNVAALTLGVVYVRLFRRRDSAPDDPRDPEATPRRVIGFAGWLALANAAVLMLAVLPRVALSHVSYAELAYFDLALLIYTLPQRLKASFVMAVLPIASAEHKRGARMSVPSARDLALLTAAVGVLDAILWRTHAIEHVLDLLGAGQYVRAEPLFLIVLLAAPAEIFYGLNSGLLQALGYSRRLALAALAVLLAAAIAAPFGYFFGPYYLAVVLTCSYWALYATSRRLLAPAGIDEVHLLGTFARRFTRRWPGLSAPTAGER